jgi:hypothetical protein
MRWVCSARSARGRVVGSDDGRHSTATQTARSNAHDGAVLLNCNFDLHSYTPLYGGASESDSHGADSLRVVVRLSVTEGVIGQLRLEFRKLSPGRSLPRWHAALHI